MNTTLSFFTVAAAVKLLASQALALGQPRGHQGLLHNRAQCRVEANRKGLIDPPKRVKLQYFMQTRADGSS